MIIVRTGLDNNVSKLLVKSGKFHALHLPPLSPETPTNMMVKDEKAYKSARKKRTGEGPLVDERVQQNSERLKMVRRVLSVAAG